jgi:peptidoglycan/LPS O-acetylase OafA/YrhL
MVEVGRVSYGIYLFESIAIFVADRMINLGCGRIACLGKDFALVLVLSMTLAELHYRVVERRFMAWRERIFAPRLGSTAKP